MITPEMPRRMFLRIGANATLGAATLGMAGSASRKQEETAMTTYAIQQRQVFEVAFESTRHYENPYQDVDFHLVITLPDGNEQIAPGFWAGDNIWKARVSISRTGDAAFRTICSNEEDVGLHGRAGVFAVQPYSGANPLLQRGRLRIAEDKRHFAHEDGTPFLWIGDTWWMGLSARLDWPHGFQELTADRVAKGFNVIQIVAGPYPDMPPGDPRNNNEAGYPFLDEFARINPAYYDFADLKIAHLVRNGLVPCIVGMWGYYLPIIGEERAARFWQYLVARYAAYPVVWCLCGEGAMPWYLAKDRKADTARQKKGWTEIMRRVRTTDSYHNLITIHPTQFGRDQVEDDSLMDFEMLQTGHSDMDSVPNVIHSVAKAVAREPRMPVVNSEVNYEGILGRCWQNVQRLCCYHTLLHGAAGFTYGANGIWQANTDTPYGPSPHGVCWGNTPWREAMRLPGSAQVGHAGRCLSQFPWWELEAHPEWMDGADKVSDPYAPVATGIPEKLRIFYLPLCWTPPAVRALEPGLKYQAWYFDPCTGKRHEIGEISGDADGNWRPPIPPEAHDWLVALER